MSGKETDKKSLVNWLWLICTGCGSRFHRSANDTRTLRDDRCSECQ